MNVSLTPELEQLIDSKVAAGSYHSASEVVRDALRLLQKRDEIQAAKLSALRAEIAKGDAELKAGKYRDGDQVMADLKKRLRKLKHANG
jgi:antitoxin ParD1/3/4